MNLGWVRNLGVSAALLAACSTGSDDHESRDGQPTGGGPSFGVDAGNSPAPDAFDSGTQLTGDAGGSQNEPTIDAGSQAATDAALQIDSSVLLTDYPLLGYATLEGGTTGGSLGTATITVHSGAELQAAIDAKGSEPLTILVEGTLTHTDWRVRIDGIGDLSILGVGADAALDGFALDLTGAHNVIIRNLAIHHVFEGEGDAIRITEGTHHVWVDHCELYSDLTHGKDYYDGLIDVTHGADFVTLSWNVLRDHHKVSLIGHSDDNADEDEGTLRVTYHHNLFQHVGSRLPSVRFGQVHAFDNLFRDVGDSDERAGTAISSRMGACARIEQNLFDAVDTAVMTDQSPEAGGVELIDNEFGSAVVAMTPTCTLDVPYPYAAALEPPAGLATSLEGRVGVGVLTDPAQITTLANP